MKTTVRVGQEWEKKDTNRDSDTRIRVLSPPSTTRVRVGTVTKDGRAVRERYLLLSALSNTPKGYRLKKDVPAEAPKPRVFEASLGMEEALDAAERRKGMGVGGMAKVIADEEAANARKTKPASVNGSAGFALMQAENALPTPPLAIIRDALWHLRDTGNALGVRKALAALDAVKTLEPR